ncbi:MAG TPA: hypothetical protein VGH98_06365 [Gemmatimonadaceae bacterium]|jgi:hypothetical protein
MFLKYATALTLLPLATLSSQPTAPAQQDNLRRYIDCNLGDKFWVVESAERARPFVRSVGGAQEPNQIVVTHGFSLHIAYGGTPFVNFKAERLGSYALAKKHLIHDLTTVAEGTPDMESRTPPHSSLNGFDIYAIDRTKLSGGVQSVYLLFRDADQTVVTLYVLNTPPETPRFSTIEQYHALSREFLQTYTGCVAKSLK